MLQSLSVSRLSSLVSRELEVEQSGLRTVSRPLRTPDTPRVACACFHSVSFMVSFCRVYYCVLVAYEPEAEKLCHRVVAPLGGGCWDKFSLQQIVHDQHPREK